MAEAKCVEGFQSSGTPTGQIIKFGGVDTYIARPSTDAKPKSAIILATDVFGHSYVNAQLIADDFAKGTGHLGFAHHCTSRSDTRLGFLCVVPDLFNGDPLPPNLPEKGSEERAKLFAEWRPKHTPHANKLPIIDAVIKELKEKEGIEKIGVQGYCYGGKIAVLLAAQADKVDAFAVAHPSFLSVPEDIEALQKPGLFLCAEVDQAFPDEARTKSEEILKKKGLHAEFRLYPGTQHGFAVRGDEKDSTVQAAKKAALDEGIAFFKKQLA